MAYAQFTVSINRPVNEVYDFILNGENNKFWRPSVIEVKKETDESVAVGTKFIQSMKGPFGKKISGDYEITGCETNNNIAFKVVSGPARPSGNYDFNDEGTSTKVTFTLSLTPTGIARLMDPMINKQMQLEVANLSNMKTYLEKQH
ncbi:SRPBCC family protein [Sporolactobacillus putidus]|uniref:Polyketide cyclase / dehydrase and lipid transport n=1 Tax=Sporolactobacillus putidus TaxID=492735 RepID=A0A917W2G4_9BACL|nr:SRPBCC family protein [Sporolactobacillus putidus]GGL54944.1 hypothetical protein GCM10007968_18780 [Sporolactobacillus putidus]